MFSKVKDFLLMVAGAAIGFLCLILGIRKRKIETLETENKVKDVTIRTVKTAKDAESVHAVKMSDITKDASKRVESVTKGEESYNDMVKKWNEKSD